MQFCHIWKFYKYMGNILFSEIKNIRERDLPEESARKGIKTESMILEESWIFLVIEVIDLENYCISINPTRKKERIYFSQF